MDSRLGRWGGCGDEELPGSPEAGLAGCLSLGSGQCDWHSDGQSEVSWSGRWGRLGGAHLVGLLWRRSKDSGLYPKWDPRPPGDPSRGET